MMKSMLSLIALSLPITPQVFAADLVASFELRPDFKSYHFILSNFENTSVDCKKFVIEAEIGEGNCSKPIATYQITETNVQLAPGANRVNSNFGLDYLHQQNTKSKLKPLIYCGSPTIVFTCN